MVRLAGVALLLLLLLPLPLGLPACGNVSWAFCSGWFCYGWEPYPPPCYPYDGYWCYSSAVVTVADVDADGHDDILTGGPSTGTLTVLLGNGRGEFRVARGHVEAPGTGIDLMAIGRFDATEGDDLAVFDAKRDEVRIYAGDGAGAFVPVTTVPLATTGDALALLAAAGDGTGPDHLLVVESTGRIVRVDATIGAAAAHASVLATDVGLALTAAAVADLDGDGVRDLVVADELGATVEVWLGALDGSFDQPLWSGATGGRPAALVLARLDADAHTDLAVLDGLDGSLRVFLGRGDGTFEASERVPLATAPGRGIALAAIPGARGDKSTSDLVALVAGPDDADPARLIGLESDDAGVLRATGAPVGLPRTRHIVPADLNEDGIPDLVFPGGRRSAVGTALGGVRER